MINTGGGGAVEGSVNSKGDFAGRDHPEQNVYVNLGGEEASGEVQRDKTLAELVHEMHDALVGNKLTGQISLIDMTKQNQAELKENQADQLESSKKNQRNIRIVLVLLILVILFQVYLAWNVSQIWQIVHILQDAIR